MLMRMLCQKRLGQHILLFNLQLSDAKSKRWVRAGLLSIILYFAYHEQMLKHKHAETSLLQHGRWLNGGLQTLRSKSVVRHDFRSSMAKHSHCQGVATLQSLSVGQNVIVNPADPGEEKFWVAQVVDILGDQQVRGPWPTSICCLLRALPPLIISWFSWC